MRTIRLVCDQFGDVEKYDLDNDVFSQENDEITVEITFPLAFNAYRKRLDIYVDFDKSIDYIEGDVANVFTVQLTSEHLKQGNIILQPIAYLVEVGKTYNQSKKQKWETKEIEIEYSINVGESTVNVDKNLGEQLQDNIDLVNADIDAINAEIPTLMKLDASNSGVIDMNFFTNGATSPSFGHIRYNSTERTFQAGLPNGVVGDFFSETFYPVGCKNVDTVQINDGDFVMYFGAEGNSGVITVKRASTSLVLAGAGMGIATENIGVNQVGKVTWFGYVRGIQTNGANYGETWVDGQMIYNSGTIVGGLSKNKPIAPKNAVFVGIVIRAHSSNGILLVRPMFFPRLEQLSNVYIDNPLNGDVLTYDSVNQRWYNKHI